MVGLNINMWGFMLNFSAFRAVCIHCLVGHPSNRKWVFIPLHLKNKLAILGHVDFVYKNDVLQLHHGGVIHILAALSSNHISGSRDHFLY